MNDRRTTSGEPFEQHVEKFITSESEMERAYGRLLATGVGDVFEKWLIDESQRDPEGMAPSRAIIAFAAMLLSNCIKPSPGHERVVLGILQEELGQRLLNCWPQIEKARERFGE